MEQQAPISVEQARERDLEALCDVDRAVIGDHGRMGFLADAVGAGRCFVARLGTKLVGFVCFEHSFSGHGFISLLVVHPDHRRLGAATALIRHIEALCPTEKLFTSTNASNKAMRRVCEALGFVRSGGVDNLDEGEPEIVFFKSPSRTSVAQAVPTA